MIIISTIALWANLPIYRLEIEKRIPLFLFFAEIRQRNDGAAKAETIMKKEKPIAKERQRQNPQRKKNSNH